jgi:hypothetical protein
VVVGLDPEDAEAEVGRELLEVVPLARDPHLAPIGVDRDIRGPQGGVAGGVDELQVIADPGPEVGVEADHHHVQIGRSGGRDRDRRAPRRAPALPDLPGADPPRSRASSAIRNWLKVKPSGSPSIGGTGVEIR